MIIMIINFVNCCVKTNDNIKYCMVNRQGRIQGREKRKKRGKLRLHASPRNYKLKI